MRGVYANKAANGDSLNFHCFFTNSEAATLLPGTQNIFASDLNGLI
jgi:hypothetical protein